jgi:uncharacterized protein YndB with AHSA1/START domain
MTVTNVSKDLERLTMTVTAEFEAPISRLWQVWDDPRQLERWWGPPEYPATFGDHDLRPGGTVTYFMTGPDGEKYHGWWRITAMSAPERLEFVDGFADDTGAPNPDMPETLAAVTLTEMAPGRTRMTIESTFPSLEVMEQMAEMGMEEGIRAAVGQIEEILLAG